MVFGASVIGYFSMDSITAFCLDLRFLRSLEGISSWLMDVSEVQTDSR